MQRTTEANGGGRAGDSGAGAQEGTGRGAGADGNASLLEIRDLRTHFFTDEGVARSVDGVSFAIRPHETLGVVGESGCGKSVTALSIMRLIQQPPGRIVSGEILFEGRDLLALEEREMRGIRGNDISMIFQEPMSSLNPVYTVGDQIGEAIVLHQRVSRSRGRAGAIEMLQRVGIASPATRVDEYPHQLSGGMRQRVMIAMALSCNPSLLIADEPTTALDVTIQAQILELLNGLQRDLGMAVMLITHDLGVIAETAHRVVVMYAGIVVEESDVVPLFDEPKHPYTQGLLESVPKLTEKKSRLATIAGTVPSPVDRAPGCPYANRCPYVMEICRIEMPLLAELAAGHSVRCHLYPASTVGDGAPYARGRAHPPGRAA
ncbi:MAG: ABC transporter ATP-binding protein [Gemmatimonadetes bacterium]|nr:ABC transporter ATP-binding protein [Gemmatimonadota bacterium]